MTNESAIKQIVDEVCSGCYGSDEEPHKCKDCGFNRAIKALDVLDDSLTRIKYKCRHCEHYEQTEVGKRSGMYGRCIIRNSRTDRSNGRQGGCYACLKFKLKEES